MTGRTLPGRQWPMAEFEGPLTQLVINCSETQPGAHIFYYKPYIKDINQLVHFPPPPSLYELLLLGYWGSSQWPQENASGEADSCCTLEPWKPQTAATLRAGEQSLCSTRNIWEQESGPEQQGHLSSCICCRLFGASSAAKPSCDDWNNHGNLELIYYSSSSVLPFPCGDLVHTLCYKPNFWRLIWGDQTSTGKAASSAQHQEKQMCCPCCMG